MAPAFFMIFVMTPLLYTLNILERQDIVLIWNVGRFALVVAALIILPRVGASPAETVAIYSGAVTVAYGVLFAVCVWQTGIAASAPAVISESRSGSNNPLSFACRPRMYCPKNRKACGWARR